MATEAEGCRTLDDQLAAYRKKAELNGDEQLPDSELQKLMGSYGWLYLNEVTNKTSSHDVTVDNPYYGKTGIKIKPGKTDSESCKGWIPYSSSETEYKITYYNKSLQGWKTVTLKDVGENWLLSIEQTGMDQDQRVLPNAWLGSAEFRITLMDTGYEIYSDYAKRVQGRMSWQPI